ncbi:MAG: ASKHA domain-containing protein [Oscillospiraceae bacterium]|nr:ASKHA domain-containing protein [Oscillospiraceae bacterium]
MKSEPENVTVKLIHPVYGEKLLTLSRGEAIMPYIAKLGAYAPCGGRGSCGKCRVLVSGCVPSPSERDLAMISDDELKRGVRLACMLRAENMMTIEISEIIRSGEMAVEKGTDETFLYSGHGVSFALDIGTTSLALALVDNAKKKTIEVFCAENPQKAFGADVMSRIEYCSRGGLNELNSLIISEINGLVKKAAAKYDVPESETNGIYVCGNMTMLHILFGINCTSMGVAPYNPFFINSKNILCADIGIKLPGFCRSLPGISAFVGADIVAGIYSVTCKFGYPPDGKYDILIDLGTNAEIAVFDANECVASAAAAGPCFEGANIECGMPAVTGAVCSFCLSNGKTRYETIGKAEPGGICGTGLIDAVAFLLREGLIDETGAFEGSERYDIAPGVYISQRDIREFSLAKSAVRAATEVLINIKGACFDSIRNVYVAGGFSSAINISNACEVGLFPKKLAKKLIPVSNSALSGTLFSLLSGELPSESQALARICKGARYIDLAKQALFTDKFIQNMTYEETY